MITPNETEAAVVDAPRQIGGAGHGLAADSPFRPQVRRKWRSLRILENGGSRALVLVALIAVGVGFIAIRLDGLSTPDVPAGSETLDQPAVASEPIFAGSESSGTPNVLTSVPSSGPSAPSASVAPGAVTAVVDPVPEALARLQAWENIATWTVQPGDSLGVIAREFDTTVQAIVLSNHPIDPNILFIGQTLRIPVGFTSADELPAADPLLVLQDWDRVAEWVMRGQDTLAAIAAEYLTSVDAILRFNGLSDASAVAVGDRLRIPWGFSLALPEDAETPTSSTPAE